VAQLALQYSALNHCATREAQVLPILTMLRKPKKMTPLIVITIEI
jgi:hypothetical protein